MSKRTQIIVLGAGFAGLQATKAFLKRAPDAELTLIDTNTYATMLPALPDLLSGRVPRPAVTRELADIFPQRVRLVQDEITSMDFTAKLITGTKETYRYDYLVVATGSKPAFFGFAPKSGTLHTLHSYPAAEALRAELTHKARDKNHATLVVVGAGYTGLEAAACANHGYTELRSGLSILVVEKASDILTFLSAKGRQKVRTYLQSINVELRTGVSLAELSSTQATLSDGTTIDNPVVCWTAGMQGANEHIAGSFEQTRDRRLETNEYLQLPDHPNVFIAGDSAALSDGASVLRRAVNFAYYSGSRAADNCVRIMKGRKPRPFHPVDLGWVIPLGDMSLGKVFGVIPVGGKLGLRIHYFMSGFRHFGLVEAWEFIKTALYLGRAADRPDQEGSPE
ncbi:MAG: hypothetical protein EA428_13625 [Spirochaetaceae bacterium]|nr:MAG: hypothetical protein EA428_13625 [Spirochaetaceae bacterium]